MQRDQMGGTDTAVLTQLNNIAQSRDENAADKLFTLHAAIDNLWEISFSQLVLDKSQDPKVKEVAKHIINDHRQANQRLQPIAQQLNVDLPDQLSAMKQAELKIFNQMPTEELEKAYLCHQRAAHAKDVSEFADKQKDAKNAQVKAYAAETLPKLREHAGMVETAAVAKGLSPAEVRVPMASGRD